MAAGDPIFANPDDTSHYEKPQFSKPQSAKYETVYPPFRTVALVMVALYIAMFLVALVSHQLTIYPEIY
jgi:hypothetical protein